MWFSPAEATAKAQSNRFCIMIQEVRGTQKPTSALPPLHCATALTTATNFFVSPRGIELSMEHPTKGEKLPDMGNFGQLLITQPDRALKVIHSMGQHTAQLRHKFAAFE